MKTTALLLTLGALAGTSVWAQEAHMPPKVVRIFREQTKQGRDAAHEKVETAYARMLARNKYPTESIALSSLSGESELWFIEAHPSFESIENTESFVDHNAAFKAEMDKMDALDGELRASSNVIICVFRPDLSYHAAEFAARAPKQHFVSLLLVRMKPGMSEEMVGISKTFNDAAETAHLDEPDVVYQVIAGGSSDQFLIFSGMESMKALDMEEEHDAKLMEAMGAESMRNLMKHMAETSAYTDSEVFAVRPGMSYVSREWAAPALDFWFPKPAKPAGKPAAKPAGKPGE
jgi:hypothetical protein